MRGIFRKLHFLNLLVAFNQLKWLVLLQSSLVHSYQSTFLAQCCAHCSTRQWNQYRVGSCFDDFGCVQVVEDFKIKEAHEYKFDS